MKIVNGSKARIPDMKELWLEAFPEDSEFVDVFFRDLYKPSKTLLRYDGKTLASMLFWFDVKIKYKKRVFKGAYLYGVATRLSERHAGHFTALHSHFTELLKSKKYKFIATLPANDRLFSFYKRLGYTLSFRKTEYTHSSLDFNEISSEEAWERHLADYQKSKASIKLLESREMFLESTRNHHFLGFDGGYFAFYKSGSRYIMYDVCDPENTAPSHELTHYEKSAVLLDLDQSFDPDLWDKEKPILNFMMN